MSQKNIKYYPLLRLLTCKYDWSGPRLRTARDYACLMIRVHGSSLSEDMCNDILKDLRLANDETIKDNKILDEHIKIISELQ